MAAFRLALLCYLCNEYWIDDDVHQFGRLKVFIRAAFLSTCANQNGSRESKRFALKLALGTYEQLYNEPSYGKPNSFLYGSTIKACGRLTSDDKENSNCWNTRSRNVSRTVQLTKTNFKILLKSAPRPLKHKHLSGLGMLKEVIDLEKLRLQIGLIKKQ